MEEGSGGLEKEYFFPGGLGFRPGGWGFVVGQEVSGIENGNLDPSPMCSKGVGFITWEPQIGETDFGPVTCRT